VTSGRSTAAPARPPRSEESGQGLAAAELDALGTRARVVAWPAHRLGAALAAVSEELARLDRQASRFRTDSELSRVHAAGGGRFLISRGLADAIDVALAAARFTGGRVDPTVGAALIALGYDRDFEELGGTPAAAAMTPASVPAPGHTAVSLAGRLLRLPAGVLLDLGATAKGLGADRAARAALRACGQPGGVLVSLGGDIAVAGEGPVGGWPVLVAERPAALDGAVQLVRIAKGGLATSSVLERRWRFGGSERHHIVDPRSGLPTSGPWRSATVAAASCAEANAASTAAIVAGAGAVAWLRSTGLPGRLVDHDGSVTAVGGWPAPDDECIAVPSPRLSRQPLGGGVP